MTLLDDRPAAPDASAAPESTPARSSSPTATWNFASRLARREVRRRPGRTLLVMLLIAIPVMGMATASIVARTTAPANGDTFTQQYGSADVIVATSAGSPFGFDRNTEVLGDQAPPLPDGTSFAEVMSIYSPIRAEVDGAVVTEYVQLNDADLDDPMFDGAGAVTDGRVPEGPDEAFLSRRLADQFGVDVGDRLRLVRPDLTLDVVGIGGGAQFYEQNLIVIPNFDRDLVIDDQLSIATLIDLPSDLTQEEQAAILESYRAQGSNAYGRTDQWTYGEEDVTGQQLAWGWVAGMVAFVAVGIVIAAAFATSARRQLVTIGQLAANGAPQRLVQRTMALQGAWTGALGAIVGLAIALVGVGVGDHYGWLDRFAGRETGSLDIVPIDMIVIALTAVVAATGAALVPARSAARIPVLTALAGRRPVSTPPNWLAPTGVVLLVGGLLLLFGAAGTQSADDFTAAIAVLGSLAILFGMVCASPLIVAGIGVVGSRFGGVIRLAARSLDRGRARSAAVLTAVATVIALAVAGATVARTAENSDHASDYDPDLRTVSVAFQADWFGNPPAMDEISSTGIFDQSPQPPTELPTLIREPLETLLPDATWTPITMLVVDPPPYNVNTGLYVGDTFDGQRPRLTQIAVADEALLDRLDYSDELVAALDEQGILGGWAGHGGEFLASDGRIVEVVGSEVFVENDGDGFTDGVDTVDGSPATRDPRVLGYVADSNGRYVAEAVVSERFVEENGLDAAVAQYFIDNPADITKRQRDAINELQPHYGPDAFVVEASAPGFDGVDVNEGNVWYVWTDSPITRTPWGLIQLGVALASLVMVLLVVAIGLSLAATESRDERDVLHAVGAAPKTLRRVAAAKAWVITTGAAVVAIPTGYATMFVISRANDSTAPFPVLLVLALLFAVPAIAASATFVVSAIAQRVRPITASTASVV
jgi:putative ABC transport system permease protein